MSNPILNERQLQVLNSHFIGCLSTVREKDGHISTNPVTYTWTGEEIEISTLKNRVKYKNLLANPRATFCVIDPKNHMSYVEMRGTVRFVDDPGGEKMRATFFRITGEYPPEDLDPPDSERVMLYLKAEQISSPALYAGKLDEYQGKT